MCLNTHKEVVTMSENICVIHFHEKILDADAQVFTPALQGMGLGWQGGGGAGDDSESESPFFVKRWQSEVRLTPNPRYSHIATVPL